MLTETSSKAKTMCGIEDTAWDAGIGLWLQAVNVVGDGSPTV